MLGWITLYTRVVKTYNENRPKTVGAFINPELHDVEHLDPDGWLTEVEVSLFNGELVEVVLLTFLVPFPYCSTELADLKFNKDLRFIFKWKKIEYIWL